MSFVTTLKSVRLFAGATIISFLAACASTSNSSDEALAKLCAQQDLSRTSQRVVLAGGYYALEKNDLVCAERLTLDAKQKDLKDAYAWLNLGAIYQRTGRIELARAHYAKAMQLDGGPQGKDQTKGAEVAHIATREQSKGNRPGQIAQFNLSLLSK